MNFSLNIDDIETKDGANKSTNKLGVVTPQIFDKNEARDKPKVRIVDPILM